MNSLIEKIFYSFDSPDSSDSFSNSKLLWLNLIIFLSSNGELAFKIYPSSKLSIYWLDSSTENLLSLT
jgi:hypothetical protein